MKKIWIGLTCLAATLTFLTSCNDDDIYSVSLKVDGQSWVSNGYAAGVQTQSGVLINATNKTLPVFILHIGQFANPGVYAIDSVNNFMQFGESSGAYKNRATRPGIVVVTEVEPSKKRIVGQFSGPLYNSNNDSIMITEGKFDINYQ